MTDAVDVKDDSDPQSHDVGAAGMALCILTCRMANQW